MNSTIFIVAMLLSTASAVPLWFLLARLGLRQNGRLTACLLVPLLLGFTVMFFLWLAETGGALGDPEQRGWLIVGFFVSGMYAAVPAIVGVGIGFFLEGRYGHRAP